MNNTVRNRTDRKTYLRLTVAFCLFAAMALHIFYRNADLVKMAMQTQICNLNESLFDTNGKNFLKTPTFYVMKLFREHLTQYLLEDALIADDEIDALATVSEDGTRVTLTAANKALYDAHTLKVCDEIGDMRIVCSDIVTASNVRACNTYTEPELVRDAHFDTSLPSITIPPHSGIRLVLEKR